MMWYGHSVTATVLLANKSHHFGNNRLIKISWHWISGLPKKIICLPDLVTVSLTSFYSLQFTDLMQNVGHGYNSLINFSATDGVVISQHSTLDWYFQYLAEGTLILGD